MKLLQMGSLREIRVFRDTCQIGFEEFARLGGGKANPDGRQGISLFYKQRGQNNFVTQGLVKIYEVLIGPGGGKLLVSLTPILEGRLDVYGFYPHLPIEALGAGKE